MQSEFSTVQLDIIRYSLVWEGSETLYKGLSIGPEDHLLIITSAGCNVLNALLKNPKTLTAIDLNPIQNQLLEFKRHVILHHDYAVYRGILGLEGSNEVASAWKLIQASLPAASLPYWTAFFATHPNGLFTVGKLESYLNSFIYTLEPNVQAQWKELIEWDSVAEQKVFFDKIVAKSSFKKSFIHYFNDENLSKGRDPRLFKHTKESGGEAFYQRLEKQVSTVLLKDNFYFRFFFFGAESLPEAILPPCYQSGHYALLRTQLSKLKIVTGEAIDYLVSAEGAAITKASLSNIFEYTTEAEFKKVYEALIARKSPLVFLFWNLLHNQSADYLEDNPLTVVLSQQEPCFYFRNVKVYQPIYHPTLIH